MQRDTDFTIGDIVPSLDVSSFGPLSRQSVPLDTFSNLRFLEIPPHLGTHNDLPPRITCELTERGTHREELNYVAVSYCWQSFSLSNANTNNDSSKPSPTVQVKQHGKLRDPQCPADVLLRAITYAVSQNVSLIWIDQECVDQTDPTDVQDHLRCNDTIFSQAKFKIGLLSFELANERQHSVLIGAQLADHIPGPMVVSDWGIKNILNETKYLTRLLKAISRDRWFTRAWVFQERYSANIDMTLLLPVSFQPSSSTDLIGRDFALSVGVICSIGLVWRKHLSDPGLEQHFQENAITVETIHESLISLHDAAQRLSGPIFSGASLDTVWSTKPDGAGPSQAIDRVRNFTAYQAFLGIESCDCSVLADRVTILSNVMGFEWRLPTTPFGSYSFALVSLLVTNRSFPSVLVRTKNESPPNMFSRSVSAMDLIVHTCNLKILAAADEALQPELRNVSRALENVFGRDITQPESIKEAVQDLMLDLYSDGHYDPPEYLSALKIKHIRSRSIIPLSSTIDEIMKEIVAVNHVDNVGLDHRHGEIVTSHGIRTNQLKEGDSFIAFDGDYRWRSRCIDNFFN